MTDKIILEGVVGSTAYGMAGPDSDVDMLGVFLKPNSELLSLNPGPETKVQNDPDKTYHELNKYVALCMKNNPTVMELLWLDEYSQLLWQGSALIERREQFLSQQVRQTYGGYALQQKERLLRRGDFAADLKKRTSKHGRHCFRLLLQGLHILQHGEIRVKLTEEERDICFHAGEVASTNVDEFAKMFEDMDAKFRETKSELPEKPDYNMANELIWYIREV